MYDVDQLRATEFPLSEHEIYFNHAAISPLPTRTQERMAWAVRHLHAQPSNFFMEEGQGLAERIREGAARLLNAARKREIEPISTTSAALNTIAQAIPLEAGDNVIFCEIEFPSNAYPWMSLERDGVEVRMAPAVEGGLTLEGLAPLVDERTRVVAASAIQFFTGHRTNMAAIGAFCRERDILFVVDAIQAIGHMPIDVQSMNVDVLATGGQKSLLAAPGTGFLYVRDAVAERLRPRLIGPNACRDFEQWLDYDLTPRPGAARFAMGTPNVVGRAALDASLNLLLELGVENVDRHVTALAAEAIAMLERLGYEVISRPGHGPIVTFNPGLSEGEADALVETLRQQRVTVSRRSDAAGVPHVRLSLHAYNTSAELARFEQLWCDAYAGLQAE
ncbi:MAG: aminotransferase class V-fold PLP-dependent enzyme [Candidatus Promineifilaceae bacterium]|nr:aminotransferase class V-fold PLP-dependent enzyme [Candidatus Promineifilaceae bacterium]